MEMVRQYLLFQDKITLCLGLFIFLGTIALTVTHAILKKNNRSLKLWRILCCVPFCICIVHYIFYNFSGYMELTLILYGAMYFVSFLLVIWQFFYKTKHTYRISAIIVNILAVFALLVSIATPLLIAPSIGNYTHKNYKEAFLSSVERMKKEYILSDWKKIDYDALQKEILPIVEEAESKNDAVAYYIALLNYCYYFYDGHVSVQIDENFESEYCNEAKKRLAGNDFGFSMFTLDNGETVAILVDENSSAYDAGIHNGTIITKWNGIALEEAKKDIKCIYPDLSFPVEENENYLKSMFLAGKGEEQIQVSFIDDNKKEQTVTLDTMGFYNERLDKAIDMFYHKPEDILSENYTCRMLSDDCGYLRITAELPINELSNINSLFTGEFPDILEMIDSKLEEMHNEGMKKLIIDVRNNGGGNDSIGETIVSLFSDEKLFGHGAGEYKNGEYTTTEVHYVDANGKWSDVELVVLVNSECCSAGDNLVYNFSKLPNATIMGITVSQGIDQCTGGTCVLSDSLFFINYPILLTLDEDGLPLIDTTSERISKIALDERIAITEDVVKVIFGDEKRDYELEYALEYIKD